MRSSAFNVHPAVAPDRKSLSLRSKTCSAEGEPSAHPAVARLSMNLALLRAGYQICIIPPILRHEYVESLELAHKDTKPFTEFIAGRIVETEKDILRLFGESTALHEGAKQIYEGANSKVSLENEGVNAVCRLITEQPGLNTRDLAELTGKSRSSVERYIRTLKANGRIEFRGAAKNGGYYPQNE